MHSTNPRFLTIKAFTLIEFLLSLALLSIILFFSIPLESSLHQNNQVQVIQNDIKNAIHYAKTQALITGHNVILTPLQNSDNWSNGMLLFIDNATHHYTSKDKLIHEWHWQSHGVLVTWCGFQSNRYLLFSADASQNAVNGTFSISNNSNNTGKIVINKFGRVIAKFFH